MFSALALPWVVLAQASQPAPDQNELEKQFQESLAADKAAAQQNAPPPAEPAQPAPALSAAALTNPEIAVIGSFAGTIRRDGDVAPSFRAGDDPPIQGVNVQELELSFAADVDPYFKMRAFLTMPGTDSIEIEEAYLVTTALPRGFLFKGGAFRSSFGRNNEQHLHVQDFARRPKATELLGEDGLRAPGAQLSWLAPLPWYTSVFVEYMGLSEKPSATAGIEQFFDLSDTWSLLWGVSGATLQRGAEDMMPEPEREYLLGSDVYLKWKPTNVTQTYAWVAFTAEFIASRTKDKDWDGASYAQLVAQVARRVRVGARVDLVGYPRTDLAREVDASASIAFLPSEFSRLRLTYAHDHGVGAGGKDNDYWILQLEGTIGAHGAHPF